MVQCARDGSRCYWYSSKKKWNDCSVCGWACPDKCHPGHILCAACFEEWNDAEAEKDPEQYYPACMAPECRAKTSTQRGQRDKAMNKQTPAVWLAKKRDPPPPPPLPQSVLAAASSSAAAAPKPYVPAPPTAAGTSSVDVRMLQDTVTNLQAEVRDVSAKMDLVMDILETLRLAVCLSQPVPVAHQ